MEFITSDVDITGVTSYVCAHYGSKTTNIDKARYVFKRVSGRKKTERLARPKKIDCAALPPCLQTRAQHIKRANYGVRIWKNANQIDPTSEEKYTDYGWVNTENGLQLLWFTGSCVPASLTRPSNQAASRATTSDNTADASSTDDEHSDNAWNDDSDSDGSEA